MWSLLQEKYADKVFRNKIFNFLNKKISDEELLLIKNSKCLEDFLRGIGLLPYMIQRKLYLYLYE